MHNAGMNGLYFTVPSYDIFMHILGGIGIGLAVSAGIKLHGNKVIHKKWFIVIGVLIVGLVWEFFEIYFDITGFPLWSTPHIIDTVKDLIDDMIGGGIVALVYFFGKKM